MTTGLPTMLTHPVDYDVEWTFLQTETGRRLVVHHRSWCGARALAAAGLGVTTHAIECIGVLDRGPPDRKKGNGRAKGNGACSG